MAEEREPAQESSPPPESPAEKPAPPREESQDGQQQGAEVRASPLARRLAEEMGVDLSSLKGSGPEGRIVKEDVIAAGGTRPKADRRRAQPAAGQAAGPAVEVVEPSRMHATIARRMAEATSTISNLGMYGVDEFTAIINPPEAAILAVGAIKDVPVVEDARIVAGKLMRMTLSVDHRVFYGATAAQFMAEVKRLLENPVTLLISLP